jgi:hypothetical protein
MDRAWTGVDPDGSSLSGPVTPNFVVKHGNKYVLCILQQLQENMVFGARNVVTCGFVQNMHQHMVLCAISSSVS